MDYAILYVIGTAIFVVLFSIVIKILIDKKILTKEVVSFVTKTFNLTSKVVDELNLKKEKQILTENQQEFPHLYRWEMNC